MDGLALTSCRSSNKCCEKIISEETKYRSPSVVATSISPKPATHCHKTLSPCLTPFENGGGLEAALSGSKAKNGKEVEQWLRFKAPKWLHPGAAQKKKAQREKAVDVATARVREERDREPSLMTRTGTKLERVRLISLKSPVIECWWQRSVRPIKMERLKFKICKYPRSHSSLSLGQRSALSSSYPSQSMGRRSSSILMPEDYRSSSRQESTKRRLRRMPLDYQSCNIVARLRTGLF
ncbi:hypothetical protein PSTT_04423, partial [Puccinia striiformis]